MTIFIPDDIKIISLSQIDLPPNWNEFPHPSTTQQVGDQFVSQNESCILKIPSAVTQGDFNFLINPNHPDFSKIKIVDVTKFPFDKRIFK
jgi:RES domain-containing protein